MKNTALRNSIALLSILAVFGCDPSSSDPVTIEKATNIILFIGDGMGEEHRKAASWITVGETGFLAMDDMPTIGWAQTRSADNPVTDSAAAATAMSTGVKTNNGVIGLDANLNFVPTILEKAKLQGKKTGLVTTTQITHATPAAFAAHVVNRNMMTDIAEQIIDAQVDVILGGGEDEFLPTTDIGCYPQTGERADGRNLIDEAVAVGYTYVCDSASFSAIDPISTDRLLGLFADEGMSRPFSPSLVEMTYKAIDILSRNPAGFFLLVEGGQIDWASHSNDADNAISDTVELDKAVKAARDYALVNDDTLVIVAADHETGGMSVSLSSSGAPGEDGPFGMPDGKLFYVNWSTSSHTAADVPVTSMGPSSELLTGNYENTQLYDVMRGAFN